MQVFNVDPVESASKFNHAADSLGRRHSRFIPGRKRRREDDTPDWRASRRQRTESPPLPPSDAEDDPLKPDPGVDNDEAPMDDPRQDPQSSETK